MKKFIAMIVSALFVFSMASVSLAADATKTAPKMEEKSADTSKEAAPAKKAKKTKKAKKAKKAKKTEEKGAETPAK